MKYPDHLTRLIHVLKKLPGVGNRSAERFAFQLLQWPSVQLDEMASIISGCKEQLRYCLTCGCLGDKGSCDFCDDLRMSYGTLCVVASARDVFAIEETREFKGSYHVLGALLSPMEGRGPSTLGLNRLIDRLQKYPLHEIVMAIDSTLEGDATVLYLRDALARFPIKISRLAFGIPMGSSLDGVDGGTLARALAGRSESL